MKNKNLQPQILYPARLSVKMEGEVKSFSDRKKFEEFITDKPVLQEILRVFCKKRRGKKESTTTNTLPSKAFG